MEDESERKEEVEEEEEVMMATRERISKITIMRKDIAG